MNKFFFFILLSSFLSFAQQVKKLSAPEKNFELFWTTFKDNYAFFELKGVNWEATYIKYRPLVTKKTKEKELIAIFSEMVSPLNDGHITISKGDDVLFKVKKPSYFKKEFKGMETEFWETVSATLKKSGFTELKGIGPIFRNDNIYYTSENQEVAYIKMTRCFGTYESNFDNALEIKDTQLMLHLFDSLLTKYQNKKGIIIDLRSNGGGHGGLELSTRFTKEKQLTHYKTITKEGKSTNEIAYEPVYSEPNKGIQYLNPIVILTSDRTASSAEDFTISLYQQENVTTIGTNTSGMFSDMYGTDLPNKLSFTLSNQSFFDTNKKLLEDIGVPVKIEIKNSKVDIENGIDPVITKAVQILK